MRWNIVAECISVVFLSIIWVYSRKGMPVPSLKNRLFQACLLTTFCATVSNILSTILLSKPDLLPVIITWFITTVYYIATPLMGLAYFTYTAAMLYDQRKGVSHVITWGIIPGILYLILVAVNPFFKILFDIRQAGEYIQGPLILSTYIIFYFYCIASLVIVIAKRRWIEKTIRRILILFPILASIVIVIQQLFPSILLSGSAATSALLIIYLYLQNKQLSLDYLTGLPNRQEFLRMLDLQIRNGKPFEVVVVSLREFKQINDTFGQDVGNAFLKTISEYLYSVPVCRNAYRFSGDEFAIFVLDDANGDHVRKVIGLLQNKMDTPWEAKSVSCIIRMVIGIARYPESAVNAEGMINGIEYAVIQAKVQNDGNNICYCGPEMLGKLKRKTQIIDILREKLHSNAFDVFYQPILSTETNTFVLAESLLRVTASPLGPLYPSEFIPIAEETGLIVDMTYQVLSKVCCFVNRIAAVNNEFRGVHVNFSAVQFTQKGLAAQVFKIIQQNSTANQQIKIEITESVLAENPQTVAEFAEEMHKKGILLGLDDFGTGYSNIVTVMNTSIDIVKLDRSLIWASIINERSAIMVQSLVRIFHEMGIRVLAEGVETAEQDRFVRDCGIDLIQGFLYARPMPANEAERRLSDKSPLLIPASL